MIGATNARDRSFTTTKKGENNEIPLIAVVLHVQSVFVLLSPCVVKHVPKGPHALIHTVHVTFSLVALAELYEKCGAYSADR